MDIAVLVNVRARRGSAAVAGTCRAKLPEARVLTSHSLEDARGFARAISEAPPSLVVSAGGDGTAVALLNAMRDVSRGAVRERGAHPPLGLLPLGTGNGWARATGAPSWRKAVDRLAALAESGRALPLRRFDLIEVDGTMAHFAGTGWDAEMIDDFHEQKTARVHLLPERSRNGLAGYLYGMFTRTIPRHVRHGGQVEVELVNTGEDALTIDPSGRPAPLPGGGHGAVLYRGPVNVCAAGTTPEWGFGFRAFPFAGAVARRFCMRVYAGPVLEATMRMGALWRGAHPMPKMHTWMLTRCRATFSREVPFQVGGDRIAHRSSVEYALASEQVDVLDWHAMAA